MAKTYELNFLETSAKAGSNVYDAFVSLTKEILRKRGEGIEVKKEDPFVSKLEIKKQPVGQKKCCSK